MTTGTIPQPKRSWFYQLLVILGAQARPGTDEFRQQLWHVVAEVGAWLLIVLPVGQFLVFATQRVLWLSIPAGLSVLAGVIGLRVTRFALREDL